MPQHYTQMDQVNFMIEWFSSWSDLQKDDFLPIMAQLLKPGDHINGLIEKISTFRIEGQRRPSIFDCQVKLFQDWYEIWSSVEKERLLDYFKETDADFSSKLMQYTHTCLEDQKTLIENQIADNYTQAGTVMVPSLSNDDGLVEESHTSSPLSSLSQPLSPHDSGLEENHSDAENIPQRTPRARDNSGSDSHNSHLTPKSNLASDENVILVESNCNGHLDGINNCVDSINDDVK